MRSAWFVVLAIVVLTFQVAPFSGIAGAAPRSHSPSAKKVCKSVTKKVHGKKKRVIVCHVVSQPKPTPTAAPSTDIFDSDESPAVAVDTAGNLYATDAGQSRVVKLSPQGSVLLSWNASGANHSAAAKPASFLGVKGIAIDGQGNVYVLDGANHRVVKYDSSGNFILQWGAQGDAEGQFHDVAGLAVDAGGNVYVTDRRADLSACRVQKFSTTGQFQQSWVGPNDLWLTGGVGIGSDSSVYLSASTPPPGATTTVLTAEIFSVLHYSSQGQLLTSWQAGTGSETIWYPGPFDLDLDNVGNVDMLVTEPLRIRRFNPSHQALPDVSLADPQYHPQYIAAGTGGVMYVGEAKEQDPNDLAQNSARVVKLNASGEILAAWE